MTLEQIRTINNAMSFISVIPQMKRAGETPEIIGRYSISHLAEMEEAGVSKDITEHFCDICRLNIWDGE